MDFSDTVMWNMQVEVMIDWFYVLRRIRNISAMSIIYKSSHTRSQGGSRGSYEPPFDN